MNVIGKSKQNEGTLIFNWQTIWSLKGRFNSEMNRQYEINVEEFGEPNEFDHGFTEPYSGVLLTPRKRKRL